MSTEERLDQILTKLNLISGHLQAIDGHLDVIDGRLTTLMGLYQSLEPQMRASSKAALDFGAIATRLQTEQSRIARLVEPAA